MCLAIAPSVATVWHHLWLAVVQGLDDDLGLTRKSFTIDIEFRNLGLKLKQSGVTVLEGVNGCIRNSRYVAMPSAAIVDEADALA